MTDSRVTQVVPLVAGSDTSERRVSQVVPLVAGSDTSQRRVSQVTVLVVGQIEVGGWGVLLDDAMSSGLL